MLARLLRRYGHDVTLQTGSHLRLTSRFKASEHHLTIPLHASLRVETLAGILSDVAEYLQIERNALAEELFE